MLEINSHDDYVNALEGWLGVSSMTPQELAERVLELHTAVATSAVREVCNGDSITYQTSLASLFAVIGLAYPRMIPGKVYDIWLDCNEPIEYCVRAVLRYPEI